MAEKKVDTELRKRYNSVDLALKKAGNSLWKRDRRGKITKKNTIKAYDVSLQNLPVKLLSQDDIYGTALELARKRNLSIVTSDEIQANVYRKLN